MRKTGFSVWSIVIMVLVAFAWMLTIQTDTVHAEAESVPYYYYSLEGTTAAQTDGSCSGYTEVTDSTPTNHWSGWYVVKGSDVHISNRIWVDGEVNLILCDGAKLTAEKGIAVCYAADGVPYTLNIYGQTAGSGKLVAMTDVDDYPGIGVVDSPMPESQINIHGGVIEANGGQNGAGIHGTVTIYNGKVTAHGGNGSIGSDGGAGIGGGYCGQGGIVTVYDGTVTAYGGRGGAGIGGGAGNLYSGNSGGGGTVAVYGGEIEAVGGDVGGAGIGGGTYGPGGSVMVYDGTVTAYGGLMGGAGIGGGVENRGGTVAVYGGMVTAAGGWFRDYDKDEFGPTVDEYYNGMGIGCGDNNGDSNTLEVGPGMYVYGDAHEDCDGKVENVHTLIEPSGGDYDRQNYMIIEPAVPMTFKVKNGLWNNGDSDDKTVYLATRGDQKRTLTAEDIPAVGEKPDENYLAGSWDPVPSQGDKQEATYTYTYAKDLRRSLQQVDNGIVPDIRGGQDSCVYFGNYKQSSDGNGSFSKEPVKWRVLANADGSLLLLSDQNLDARKYHDIKKSVTWEGSSLRAWLNDQFIGGAFTAAEQTAVPDKVFILSREEAENAAYGFAGNDSRKTTNTAFVLSGGSESGHNMTASSPWWLRPSDETTSATDATAVSAGGSFSTCDVDASFVAVRPALKLDLKSALFATAAAGGKASGEVGKNALTEVTEDTVKEWKLTLLDDGSDNAAGNGHESFKIDSAKVSYDAETGEFTVPYSGAATGDNEFISAVIKDGSGNIKYYGRIAAASNATGASVTINIKDKLGDGDKLYVFNEQYNGDKKTDYASALKPVEISKPEPTPVIKVSGTLMAKMTAKGKKSLVLTWTKVSGAKGYDLYFATCKTKNDKKAGCKKVKTVKAGKTLKWTKTGLKKKTAYKAYVKAYIMKDGKKTYVRTSPLIHVYTSGGTKTYTNAKSVTVKKTTVSLKAGKTFKIKANVVKLKKSRKLMSKGHAAKLRYLSTNKKIATVSSSGKITAKKKGTCKIYVYAHNGVRRTVTVTVK